MGKRRVKYILRGWIEVTDWYGQKGFKWLDIETNESGLKDIEENPLQDYIRFGVQSVDYVKFDVYKQEEWYEDEWFYTRKTVKPIKTIEAGIPEVDEDVLWDAFTSGDVAEVSW